ncbi:isocitrate lyase/PEP mutase family protein [Roseivivax marinus]|uniref:isocitrate lyase/PEP mutase family protein n=1 Tax=Roseivivax marinus TaxID=1379903 RepID=UPI00273F1DA9|nr:isocitrate lyase/PEP mutase family protein [Roseivivax marinus]
MDMYEKRRKLHELLHADGCTPLMGAYDVLSAKIIERTGFPVLYTGSLVTGASAFGLPDVGLVQLHDLLGLGREIAKETDIPIVCDADSGWFHAGNLWRTVHEYEAAGISGMHIEDQIFGKHTDRDPLLLPRDVMCTRIQACCEARKDANFMIIARTDAIYLRGDEEDAIERANAYLEAGADAVFVVFTGSIAQLKSFRARINGPLVVTSVDFKSSIDEETEAGANMSIYWPLAIYAAYKAVTEVCERFAKGRDASQLQEFTFDEGALNRLMPYARFEENIDRYGVRDTLLPQSDLAGK